MNTKRNFIIGLLAVLILTAVPVMAQEAPSGTLTAEGDGRAKLRGSGDVTVTVQGKLVIKDYGASNAAINITCSGLEVQTVVNDNTRRYICEGTATGTVSGANIKVVALGNISLDAEGTGVARLFGDGIYTFNDQPGNWQDVGVKIEIGLQV